MENLTLHVAKWFCIGMRLAVMQTMRVVFALWCATCGCKWQPYLIYYTHFVANYSCVACIAFIYASNNCNDHSCKLKDGRLSGNESLWSLWFAVDDARPFYWIKCKSETIKPTASTNNSKREILPMFCCLLWQICSIYSGWQTLLRMEGQPIPNGRSPFQ